MRTFTYLNQEAIRKPFEHLLTNYYLKENAAGEYMRDMHVHSAVELEYVIEGELLLEFREDVARLPKDTLILIRPDAAHRFRVPRGGRGCQRVNLSFELQILTNEFRKVIENAFSATPEEYILIKRSKEVRDTMRHIVRELSDKKRNYDVITRAAFDCLLVFIDRSLFEIANSGMKTQGYVRTAKRLIEGQMSCDWTPEMIAQELNLSPSYLMHIFKAETGCGLMKYVENCRIDLAKKRLTDTMDQVQKIAEEVGYPGLPYFSYVFKKNTGISPSKYRKMSQEIIFRTVDTIQDNE